MKDVLLMIVVNEQKKSSEIGQLEAGQVQSNWFRWCANLGSCVVADGR